MNLLAARKGIVRAPPWGKESNFRGREPEGPAFWKPSAKRAPGRETAHAGPRRSSPSHLTGQAIDLPKRSLSPRGSIETGPGGPGNSFEGRPPGWRRAANTRGAPGEHLGARPKGRSEPQAPAPRGPGAWAPGRASVFTMGRPTQGRGNAGAPGRGHGGPTMPANLTSGALLPLRWAHGAAPVSLGPVGRITGLYPNEPSRPPGWRAARRRPTPSGKQASLSRGPS